MTKKKKLETASLSSLAKVFPDEDLKDPLFNKAGALMNETYSFQIAYKSYALMKDIKVRLNTDLKDIITIRKVGLVPSELPSYGDHDEQILRSTPGLYPDPLYPMENFKLNALPNQWHSFG